MEGQEKIVVEKDGKKVECDVLFTFDCDELSKSYIGYTDYSKDDNGDINIYACAVNHLSVDNYIESITDPKELEMVNSVIEDIKKQNSF